VLSSIILGRENQDRAEVESIVKEICAGCSHKTSTAYPEPLQAHHHHLSALRFRLHYGPRYTPNRTPPGRKSAAIALESLEFDLRIPSLAEA
jgi:hypothetical protein